MQIFFAPDIAGDLYELGEKESRHAVKALRMVSGEAIKLIDGRGNLYEGVVLRADPKACRISITSVTPDFEKRGYNLHIAISPLKNPERLEWFVEKSVELGIDEITPLICHNSEKKSIREERLRSIIISAMKQSLKARATVLHKACSFAGFIHESRSGKLMIAHCNAEPGKKGIEEVYGKGENAVILIGPEGDFTAEEVSNSVLSGYTPVHLGQSRLRTETAGVAACHSVYFINLKKISICPLS
ncbi:MAG: RsmE family RNA methyltransferase [Bacteroidales bacterium]|jgi:16S rRNA (uracil1498-N3)-methyltransferase